MSNIPGAQLLPQFGVDPELQRLWTACSIDFINALCRAIPRLGPTLTSGVSVVVKSDNGALHLDINFPGNQASPIIPVVEMPKNLPPINGNRG